MIDQRRRSKACRGVTPFVLGYFYYKQNKIQCLFAVEEAAVVVVVEAVSEAAEAEAAAAEDAAVEALAAAADEAVAAAAEVSGSTKTQAHLKPSSLSDITAGWCRTTSSARWTSKTCLTSMRRCFSRTRSRSARWTRSSATCETTTCR